MKLILAMTFYTLLFSPAFSAIDSEEQYQRAINDVASLYTDELKDQGLELNINWKWNSHVINQGINRKGNTLTLTVHGGLARAPYTTADSFALTVCHELGHAVGGAPSVKPANKYASEGQSDYFSTNECFKRYLKNRDNRAFLSTKAVPRILATKCSSSYSNQTEVDICQRSGLAIMSLSNLYKKGGLDFTTPDSSKVEYTIYNDYPPAQCRVDTQLAGALNLPRPACWFNKSKTNLNEKKYDPNIKLMEAQFVGKAKKVRQLSEGCEMIVRYLDFYQTGYFKTLDEGDFYDHKLFIYGKCKVKDGDSISGIATLYRERMYLNIIATDF